MFFVECGVVVDVGAEDLPGAGLEAGDAELGFPEQFEIGAGPLDQPFFAELIKWQHNAGTRPTDYRQLVDGHRDEWD